MAIKAGELIHVGNQVLVDRAQSAGPGNLTVPTEKIYELGNYQSVATVRDTPDLSFPMESLDASAELESMLCGTTFSSDADGTEYDLSKCLPLDVVSQFKAGKTATSPFNVVGSVVAPYLTLESLSYRFGLRDNASQSATLKGDSIFYAAGSGYVQETAGTNTANQVVNFAQTPLVYKGDTLNGDRWALSVSLKSGKRLVLGTDYTETVTAVTILAAVPVSDKIRISYQSATAATYPQASHAAASATRPAAIKGRDIEVLVGGVALSDRWSSVQSVQVDWRAQLEKDEEFGNAQIVAQDYDVPEVSGSVEIKPKDFAELMTRVRKIAGVSATNEVVGPLQTVTLPLTVVLHSPTDGAALKTLYVEDARFTLPGFNGQVQQKLTVTIPFESDGGNLKVYKGEKP